MRNTLIAFFLLLSTFSFSQFPGCPSVDAGVDQSLSCSTPCATLTATPFQAGATTSYSVASIPATPPIAYNAAGGTGVSVGTDDVWSPQIALPFNFCFYGTNYNNCKIGSNGSIKFNAGGGGSQNWSFSASLPATTLSSVGDIFGIYHDIDPSIGGTVKWYVTGTAPCRIFVVSYYQVPQFSCTTIESTFMMVLYETTNVIDVYVDAKPLCSSWNDGNAIIGIQNPAGTVGITAPNRNTTPTWTVSTPEAWRFVPNGAPIYALEWFQGATSLGTNPTINVCPVVPTTYTAQATYTACDGTVIVKTDDVVVTPNPGMPSGNIVGTTDVSCSGTLGSATVQASGGSGSGYQYSIDNGATWQASGVFTGLAAGSYTITVQDGVGCQGGIPVTINSAPPAQPIDAGPAQTVCQGTAVTLSGIGAAQTYTWDNGVTNGVPFVPTGTTTYHVVGTDFNGCTSIDSVVVTVTPGPNVQAGPDKVICAGDAVILTATGATTYVWDNGVSNGISFAPTSTQTYTVVGTDAGGCQATAQVTVTVNPLPTINAGPDQIACDGNNVTLTASGGQTYVWNNGVVDGTPFIPGATQTFTVTGTDANGCQNSDQVVVTVVPYPTAVIGSDVVEGYPELTVNFTNNSTNATSYQWNFGNGSTNSVSTTAGQQSIYPTPGDYTVILTAANGNCVDTDTLSIHVFPFLEPTYVLPNIITPNGDKVNDVFFITCANVKDIKVLILNRWGEKVGNYQGVNGYWDGTINGNQAVEGVYFVQYELEDLYGNITKGQGNVSIVK